MKSVMGTAPLLQQLRVLWLVVAKKAGLADAAERLKAESMAVAAAAFGSRFWTCTLVKDSSATNATYSVVIEKAKQ